MFVRYSYGLVDCLQNSVETRCGHEAAEWLHRMKMHVLSPTLNEIGCERNSHLGAAAILGIVVSLLVTFTFVCGLSFLFRRHAGWRLKQSISLQQGSRKSASYRGFNLQEKRNKLSASQNRLEARDNRLSSNTLVTGGLSSHPDESIMEMTENKSEIARQSSLKVNSLTNSPSRLRIGENNPVSDQDQHKSALESETEAEKEKMIDCNSNGHLCDDAEANHVTLDSVGACAIVITQHEEDCGRIAAVNTLDAEDTSDEFTSMLNEATV